MRLGVYGGAFDPPHLGHLVAASDACQALELDRLLWIPSAVHPLKAVGTAPALRLEMVREVYKLHGNGDALIANIFDGPHSFNDDARAKSYAMLERELRI